jgi:hypothetical protein
MSGFSPELATGETVGLEQGEEVCVTELVRGE